jgi:hypothetical protein
MSIQFADYTLASIQIEKVDGQEVERRLDFSLNSLDYSFVFNPPSDPIEGGATLVYVGDIERGRLAPSKYADGRAWQIANAQLAY